MGHCFPIIPLVLCRTNTSLPLKLSMSFAGRGFVWRNDVTLFKNTTPPLKTRGFFVVRKEDMENLTPYTKQNEAWIQAARESVKTGEMPTVLYIDGTTLIRMVTEHNSESIWYVQKGNRQ